MDNRPYDVNISLEGVPSLSTIPISVSKPLPTRFNISMNTNGTYCKYNTYFVFQMASNS